VDRHARDICWRRERDAEFQNVSAVLNPCELEGFRRAVFQPVFGAQDEKYGRTDADTELICFELPTLACLDEGCSVPQGDSPVGERDVRGQMSAYSPFKRDDLGAPEERVRDRDREPAE